VVERHPERLDALRAMIQAGDLQVVRREPKRTSILT
jgi:3-deoxy-D-manno-octulosonic-acid transferase